MNVFRIELKALEGQAATRPAGYLEEVKSKGTVNGPYLEIPIEQYIELFRKYSETHAAPKFIKKLPVSSSVSASGAPPVIPPRRYPTNLKENSPNYSNENKMRGVGDIVAKVAQPIAKGLDKVLGTHIQGCGGCKKRQEKLNQVFPFNNTSSKGP